ncbi:FxLYD domain-containing protein [Natronosalvus vescus]|uniref:FxLYD domain-containing protein n=1 Tax=Natronosalvus vescus TaxID=2953881 RepID=UPI002090E818|nr:FxLYD domain-containing protein [Natronosalvus vescus]
MADDIRSRRRLLTTTGVALGSTLGLAGCLGRGGPAYDGDGTEPGRTPVDADGEARTTEEMAAASALAVTEPAEGVSPVEGIEIADHAFVLEDDFRGSTVQGRLENTGDDRLSVVEVRVRVYDEAGAQLGLYLDRTSDLEANTAWSFTVILLEAPSDIASYDIAAVGAPA